MDGVNIVLRNSEEKHCGIQLHRQQGAATTDEQRTRRVHHKKKSTNIRPAGIQRQVRRTRFQHAQDTDHLLQRSVKLQRHRNIERGAARAQPRRGRRGGRSRARAAHQGRGSLDPRQVRGAAPHHRLRRALRPHREPLCGAAAPPGARRLAAAPLRAAPCAQLPELRPRLGHPAVTTPHPHLTRRNDKFSCPLQTFRPMVGLRSIVQRRGA